MPNAAAPTDEPRAASLAPAAIPRYSHYALVVLTVVNLLNYIDRQVLPSVASYMIKDAHLQLTDAEIGYMESTLLLSFTIFAPLFGRLGDRYPRAKIMALAAVIWSFATALTGAADHLAFLPAISFRVPLVGWSIALSGVALTLCLVRACVGIGESAYSTITPSLIVDYYPRRRRATALGIFQAAIPLGFSLGFVIGGVLAHFYGWRIAFSIVSVPGLITAFFVWRLREPVRGATDEPEPTTALDETGASSVALPIAAKDSTAREVWRIFSNHDWLLSTAGYTALTFVLGAFATWVALFLIRDKGMPESSAPITLGIITLCAGALGTFGGGWLADRIAKGRSRAYFYLCAASTFLSTGPMFVVLVARSKWVYLPAIFIAVTLIFVNNAPFHALLLQSVPTHVRAMAVALNIVVIHTCGDAISRTAVGVASDALKAGQLAPLAALARMIGINPVEQHLTTALLVAPTAMFISTLLFLWGARTTKQDAPVRAH
ncbi:MAG TPA: MFS transporter [Pyrinomonadaceae bacterium]|jgi:MFS family permease